MAALVLRRDLSLEVPKLLVGAAQPYQTLGGPALTTSFLHQPELLPFQRAPFHHAAVAPLYFHTLLHTLAEFATTPRAVRHSHVQLQHEPKADFWESVGTLNCFYYTVHNTPDYRFHRPFSSAASSTSAHPASGAVELVRASHRKESDVKLTLFDSHHQPMATMLMTGPKAGAQLNYDTHSNDTGAAHKKSSSSAPSPQRRTPLPYEEPPRSSEAYTTTTTTTAASSDHGGVGVSVVLLGGTRVCGGLYADVMPMGEDGTAGFAHRAYYWMDDECTSVSAEPATPATNTTGGKSKARHDAAAATAMPPWVLYDCVERFFFRLYERGLFGSDVALTSDTAAAAQWRLCSHHVVQLDDAVFGEPLEVVCAAPRVDPHYRLPPWRSQLGLPAMPSGEDGRGVPCVSLRCEVRQSGRVISTGVYFFCRWT